ncbi:MAG: hypothetical protein HC881_09400 [Leptolyngbyaceae cyanobacterium SL_7_1]|nr:hypothetical protein [Leptolyngbyaceae cyanobacterium SL_7_1]
MVCLTILTVGTPTLVSSCTNNQSGAIESAASPASTAIRISPTPTSSTRAIAANPPSSDDVLWQGEFTTDWEDDWQLKEEGAWGEENIAIRQDADYGRVMRVRYPAGSASPSVSRESNVALGGAQFYAELGIEPQTALHLSYDLRFSDDFDFVKGGKLPGLYGGNGNSGGNIPDGSDGFSTRFMWRRDGDGEVYAYLPDSDRHGTSIGRGAWQFTPGTWHHLEQEVVLNRPSASDGSIKVWFDDELVLEEDGLLFRTVDRLKLNGLFFSTFFGGGDPSWATPEDVYVDFANFAVESVE